MSDRLNNRLADLAEVLVAGKIGVFTGLKVHLTPRNNQHFDVLVNSCDMTKGALVEVLDLRWHQTTNLPDLDFNFLALLANPEHTEQHLQVYIFPKEVIVQHTQGKSQVDIAAEHIPNFIQYRDAYRLISQALR